MVNDYVMSHGIVSISKYDQVKELIDIFNHKDLRITIINKEGVVYYDSSIDDAQTLENHSNRPEIKAALTNDFGKGIRRSSSTGMEYYYYAVNYGNYIIRAALPYNVDVQKDLKVDVFFIYVILLFYIVFGIILLYLSDRFGKSIATLQEFAAQAATGNSIDIKAVFPKNELGLIGQQIVEVYNRLQKTKKALSAEREKLIRHLQISHEGIAVFTKEKTQLLANNHFIQYLNIISDESSASPNWFFNIPELMPINDFIDENLKKRSSEINDLSSNVLIVNKSGKYYVIQAIVFKDRTFEISINDVTKLEKEKKLKQQMTSNIAHELKTPVSSILGYLETILTSEMDKEKMMFFLERSHIQTQRLAALIQDISLLNKIEEASDLFEKENVKVKEIVCLVMDDLRMKIDEKNISVKIDLPDSLEVKANKSIFYSIWRNLTENSVNYAGQNITITIKNYHEDANFLYFSYSDNGAGIPEQHLARIFERFYRVDSGRARTNGGTGLGLAIVKNGVLFHKGEISVKKPKGTGIEFIFSICKEA
jgi:two-component system OmpR family sensor kinase/two-component system phosphate regulon sensor histidine kinase PhoR